ncbi:hypothetical protein RYQ61_00430 [Streptococcus intermedius]|uniref:hypothetical protein n=1 Tax=Streptococcus intermedius TaxID=1338 RepID=UPI0029439D1B|nr:hypothetical protein [Streptococcus intermedius]WOI91364.1 hypothetical protein RYQ61_00430 [Streptococcus intermedius]
MAAGFAKVIQIIDKYTLIIDRGLKHHIINGQRVQVIEPGPEIKDLNGEVLGVYDFVKAELTITEVYENYSIAKSLCEVENTLLSKSVAKMFGQENQKVETEMPINESQVTPMAPTNPNISLGDAVKFFN